MYVGGGASARYTPYLEDILEYYVVAGGTGTYSYFRNPNTVFVLAPGGNSTSSPIGDGGYPGGAPTRCFIKRGDTNNTIGVGGGSGAGGYSGAGGQGYSWTAIDVYTNPQNGTGGAGAGSTGNGGGVDIFGEGTSGVVGGTIAGSLYTVGNTVYGAGGAGASTTTLGARAISQAGSGGVVRIIWGRNRNFPTTAVVPSSELI